MKRDITENKNAVNSGIKSEMQLKYNCLDSLSWSCCRDVSLCFLSWAISPRTSKKDQTTKMSNTDFPPPGSSMFRHGNCQNARREVMVIKRLMVLEEISSVKLNFKICLKNILTEYSHDKARDIGRGLWFKFNVSRVRQIHEELPHCLLNCTVCNWRWRRRNVFFYSLLH